MMQESAELLPGPAGVPLREEIVRRLWKGDDPFASVNTGPWSLDLEGWNSQHDFLREAIAERPRIVIEVGVWKGASVIFMANLLREMAADGVVIAVDTFLGSWEHWLNTEWRVALEFNTACTRPSFDLSAKRGRSRCRKLRRSASSRLGERGGLARPYANSGRRNSHRRGTRLR